MAQTKEQRSAAAKKAAATRKRNREAATQQVEARKTRQAIDTAASTVSEAAKNVGEHAGKLTKAAAGRLKAEVDRRL
jgi:anti-sigma regulatory factor (Ser/Thr protein kinase)